MSSPGVASPETDLIVWLAGENESASAQIAEAARLHKLGWNVGLAENFVTQGNPNRYGLSLVLST